MPINRNALIRFRTIDNCLRNRQRRWTLEDLVEACSQALYEYEGIDKGVSRRSVQMDIQTMRSDKLGYNAPIIVVDKKYYTYEDPNYSITNIPLTKQDLGKLTEVVHILRQFKGFSHFQELSGMVQRLENRIRAARTNEEPVIDFEKNEDLKGLEHIETLYQAIIGKCAVRITYQSFKAREASAFNFHPYYLKEYRNRWFVLGLKSKGTPILTLALDRIVSIGDCHVTYVPKKDFNLAAYLNDVVGVTVNPGGEKERVVLLANHETAPYILTKPLHHSQQVIERTPAGVTVSLDVQLNFELEREILGFGDHVKVLAPERLKRRIRNILSDALDQYRLEINKAALKGNVEKLYHEGFCTIPHVYTPKEVRRMKKLIYDYCRDNGYPKRDMRVGTLLKRIPELKKVIFNANLLKILNAIDPRLFLIRSVFTERVVPGDWDSFWHQDMFINATEKVDDKAFTGWEKKTDGYVAVAPEHYLHNAVTVRIHLDDAEESNGAMKVIPGSHQRKLLDEEMALLTRNSAAVICDMKACGIQIMKPLLVHATSRGISPKARRVIHLEFNMRDLPEGTDWAERQVVEGLRGVVRPG